MKQLVKVFKGLYTAADENDLSLEYATEFHNCEVKQGYIESSKYELVKYESSNLIYSGDCYLGDYYKNKLEEDKILPDSPEEPIFYNYEVLLITNTPYYILRLSNDITFIEKEIGNYEQLGELKEVVNNKGTLRLYFEKDIVLIEKASRYRRSLANSIYEVEPFIITLLSKLKSNYRDKLRITANLVNESSIIQDREAELIYESTQNYDKGKGLWGIMFFKVSVDNNLVRVKFIKPFEIAVIINQINRYVRIGELDWGEYSLFTVRRVEYTTINDITDYYYTDLLIPEEYFREYFIDKYSDDTNVEFITSGDTDVYIHARYKEGNNYFSAIGRITTRTTFALIKVNSKFYTKVTSNKPNFIGFNSSAFEKNLVYKKYDVSSIGIEKPLVETAEILLTGVIDNSEIYLNNSKVNLIGALGNKFSIEVFTKVLSRFEEYSSLRKLRYYVKFNNEEPELVNEVDFYGKDKAGRIEFGITKKYLTGITLLDNTGLTYEDIQKPLIPTKIKKINNLFIGYKSGEIYLPTYGNGRFQDMYCYNSRVLESVNEPIIDYCQVNKNLMIFTEYYSQMFVIQSDKAGDIILLPMQDSLPYGIKERFQVTAVSDRVYILSQNGIITFGNKGLEMISEQIHNIIEKEYRALFITYNSFLDILLLVDLGNRKIYKFDNLTDTWSTIDFIDEVFHIKELLKVETYKDETIMLFKKDNKYYTYLLKFRIGDTKLSKIRFPKTSYDDLGYKKYITKFEIASDCEVKLKLNNKEYIVKPNGKLTIPYKDRIPFNFLDLSLEFKGKLKTIQYELEPAGVR